MVGGIRRQFFRVQVDGCQESLPGSSGLGRDRLVSLEGGRAAVTDLMSQAQASVVDIAISDPTNSDSIRLH